MALSFVGHREANSSRHLELWVVQKSHCWRCMDRVDHGGCDCPKVRLFFLDIPRIRLTGSILFFLPIVPFVVYGRSQRHRAAISFSCYRLPTYFLHVHMSP